MIVKLKILYVHTKILNMNNKYLHVEVSPKKKMGAKYLCDSDLKYMNFIELEDGLGEEFKIKAWNLLILPPI